MSPRGFTVCYVWTESILLLDKSEIFAEHPFHSGSMFCFVCDILFNVINFCHDGITCRKYIIVEVKVKINVDYMQIEYVYSCALLVYCNKME